MITDRPISNGATGTLNKGVNVGDEAASKLNQLRDLAAEKVGEAASYVRTRGIRGLQDDISDLAVKHPLGAVAVSLGVGYFLGRMLSSRK